MLARVLLLVALAALLAGCGGRPSAPEGWPPPTGPPTTCPPTTDPAAVACRIAVGEAVLRDPASTATALDDAGRRTQEVYRTLGDHPEWDAPVLSQTDPALREHVSHAVGAYRELISLAGPPRSTLPTWRIVDPLPSEALRALYDEAQRRFGVRWTVLAAVNLVETSM